MPGPHAQFIIQRHIHPMCKSENCSYHHADLFRGAVVFLSDRLVNDKVHERIETTQDALYASSTIQLHCKITAILSLMH